MGKAYRNFARLTFRSAFTMILMLQNSGRGNRMRRTFWIIFALALGSTLPALAAEGWSGLEDSLSADRPDFTEGTSIIPRGHVQVEGGTTLTRVEDVDIHTLGELLVRFGIGERSEGRIGLGSYTRIDDGIAGGSEISGFEDPAVELKVRFTEEAGELAPGQPAVALILGTTVPAGDKELTSDEWVPAAVFAFGWDLDRFSVGANLGGSYEPGDDRFVQAFGSLTGGFSVTDRLGTYVEWYGFSEEEKDGPSTHYVNGGISFLINDDLIVDARIGTGLNDADPDWFAGVGGAIRW
jgi:Putative MetA-pathway of phenol degradation